jgi:hypothetical protein
MIRRQFQYALPLTMTPHSLLFFINGVVARLQPGCGFLTLICEVLTNSGMHSASYLMEFWNSFAAGKVIKSRVNQSHYRPAQALRVPGG